MLVQQSLALACNIRGLTQCCNTHEMYCDAVLFGWHAHKTGLMCAKPNTFMSARLEGAQCISSPHARRSLSRVQPHVLYQVDHVRVCVRARVRVRVCVRVRACVCVCVCVCVWCSSRQTACSPCATNHRRAFLLCQLVRPARNSLHRGSDFPPSAYACASSSQLLSKLSSQCSHINRFFHVCTLRCFVRSPFCVNRESQ